MDIWDFLPFFSSEVGYLGLALVSFFGSLIPFVPIPSFILLITMSVGDQFNIHILALIAAITSTIAKQIIFAISYGGRRIISEKTKKTESRLSMRVTRKEARTNTETQTKALNIRLIGTRGT